MILILELSRQLTLIDFLTYKKIEPKELRNMIWNEENGIHSPNLTEICNRFHKIIEIVSNEIIDEKDLKNRQKKYKFFYN